MSDYNLIIRNGTVVDGTGGPSRIADVAISGALITLIEPDITASADQEIDATGQLVTPGFVDVHTHYDGQATWDTRLSPSSQLGATTVVMGNCGVGFAPCRPADHDKLISVMEGVEDIPGTALAEGLSWGWESFVEYLDLIDASPHDVDVAALFPHTPLRVYVMGERAINREAASEADISAMKKLLAEGLLAGAVGFSTSRVSVHRSSTGDFIPTYQAAASELEQLCATLDGKAGQIFQMVSEFRNADEEFEMLRQICALNGVKGTFTLLQQDSIPTFWQEQLTRVENAQRDGVDIRPQVLARPLGMLMGLDASLTPLSARPTFREMEKLPRAERLARLAQPEIRAKILTETDENPNALVRATRMGFSDMYPMEQPIDYMPDRGKSVAARAAAAGVSPDDWLYDWLLGSDGNNLLYIPVANFTESILDMLQHPHTVAALGDGGAHAGTICDASASITLLTNWVRKRGCISVENGVRMLTRKTAELYSLFDRGLLSPGMKADINIIDFERLNLHSPRIVHDLPAGGARFMQEAEGLTATIVSGQITYRDGQPTDNLPGRLVRGQQGDFVDSSQTTF